MIDRCHHLLPTTLPILVPPITALLGQGGVVTTIASSEVTGGLGFAAEVGLDYLLTGGVLGGNVQELPRHVRVLWPSTWMSASQVMPQMKALMTSASVMLGSSLRFLEKH
jgi:hypothetical protein